MRSIFGILSTAASIYSILLLIRIIFSWFGGMVSGNSVNILTRITDPYLNWWRRTLNLRIGFLDFSAIAAIMFLSLAQRIFSTLYHSQEITIGLFIALVLMYIWQIIAFITGFFLLIFFLRLIAYLFSVNTYNPFWQMVDSVSRPVLYKMNRIIFGRRIPGYLTGVIVPALILIFILIGGSFAMPYVAGLAVSIPL